MKSAATKYLNSITIALILVITLFLILGMGCNKSPSSPIGLYWFWPSVSHHAANMSCWRCRSR
jgi:type IV secretory pathway protease TraF